MTNKMSRLSFFGILFLSACNTQQDSSQLNSKASVLNGNWKTNCAKEGSRADDLFLQSQVQFNTGTGTVSYTRFTDGACSNIDHESKVGVQYSTGSSSSDGSTKIDIVLLTANLTVYSSAKVAYYNKNKQSNLS